MRRTGTRLELISRGGEVGRSGVVNGAELSIGDHGNSRRAYPPLPWSQQTMMKLNRVEGAIFLMTMLLGTSKRM